MIFSIILILHYIADYLLQSLEMRRQKNIDIRVLVTHTCIYITIFTLAGSIYNLINLLLDNPTNMHVITFAFVNGVVHFSTDFFVSRAAIHQMKRGKPWYAVNLFGYEQLLHTLVLYVTYIKFLE